MFISYAQNFEDVLLNRIFKDQETGFYIDIGAHHPVHNSVTKAFYDRGWKGINIEPLWEYFQLLQSDRPHDINLNIGISNEEAELNFYKLLETKLLTFDEQIARELADKKGVAIDKQKITTKTLENICTQYINQPIDFLRIDVKGWEEKVIISNDWQNFRPKIIILQTTILNYPLKHKTNISNFLANHNYQHMFFDGLNDFYLAQEFSHWTDFFSTPVNLLDQFIRFSEFEQKQHILDLEKELLIKQNEQRDLTFEITHLQKILTQQQQTLIEQQQNLAQQQQIIAKQKNNIEKQTQNLSQLEQRNTQLSVELSQEKELVKAMESSKFWKLRKKWFKVKRKIGFDTD